MLTRTCVRGSGDTYNSNQTEIYFGIYMEKLLSLVALSCACLKTQIPIFLWSSSVTCITHRLKLLLGCLGQFREVQATQWQRHRHKNKRMLAACGQRKMRREEKREVDEWMDAWMKCGVRNGTARKDEEEQECFLLNLIVIHTRIVWPKYELTNFFPFAWPRWHLKGNLFLRWNNE